MSLPFLANIRAFLQGDGSVILPEMELVLFALGILAIDLWVKQKEKYWNAALALAGTIFSGITLWMLRNQLQSKGDLLGFHETAIVDSYFLFFSALFLTITALAVLFSIRNLEQQDERGGAYYALLLFSCAGMMLMVSGIDLLVIFLGAELMAVPLFALAAFSTGRSSATSATSLRFTLTSIFSSALLIFGFSILYGLSASTNIGRIAAALGQHTDLVRALQLSREHGATAEHMRQLIQARVPIALQFDPHALQFLPLVALLLVAVGLFFKLSVAPFHFAALGVCQTAPPPVAAFYSTAAVTAAAAVFLRLLMTVFASAQAQWLYVLAPAAVLSIVWSSLGALRTNDLRRLIGYSLVAQAGFVLLAMVAGNERGLTGIAFYLFTNAFAVLGIFAIVLSLCPDERTAEDERTLAGLYRRSPALALLLAAFLFSLVGVPATAGFLGKYYILQSLLETSHRPLAIAVLICWLPALLVYGKILLRVFKKTTESDSPALRPAMNNAQAVVLGICLFVTIAAGLYPEPFVRLARYAFGQ